MSSPLLPQTASALWLGLLTWGATVTLPQNATVNRVVDGDTLVVKDATNDYTVRLIGVDAPEAHPSAKLDADSKLTRQDRDTILAMGKRAARFVHDLCDGKPCRVEYDQANADKGHRDAHGRLLVYLWVKDKRGKPLLVNAEVIRQGYARATTEYPYDKDYRDTFVRHQQEARTARRGLWARGIDPPWPTLSEAAFVGNKNSKKYHRPTCAAVERMSPDTRVELESAEEARAKGYEACKLCNPP